MVLKRYVHLKIFQKLFQTSKNTTFWVQICSPLARPYVWSVFKVWRMVCIVFKQFFLWHSCQFHSKLGTLFPLNFSQKKFSFCNSFFQIAQNFLMGFRSQMSSSDLKFLSEHHNFENSSTVLRNSIVSRMSAVS